MRSTIRHIVGLKREQVVGADEPLSTPLPTATTDSPQSTLQPLPVEAVASRPTRSESDPDPGGAPTCQPSLRERLFPTGLIYGLRVLHKPAEPLVDVILVHGLTGGSYNTWLEADSEIFWPVHLLSKDVPDARIMAFGYGADVTRFLGPVSQNNLREHASALLGELAAVRSQDDSVCSSSPRGIRR